MAPPSPKRPSRQRGAGQAPAKKKPDVELPFDDVEDMTPLRADDPQPQRVPQIPSGLPRRKRDGDAVMPGGMGRDVQVEEGFQPAFLYVERGPGMGQLSPIRQGVTLIGRASTAGLRLQHPSISRKHAEVSRRLERFFIKDLGSQNGTYVNGVRIEKETELFAGDEIVVGTAQLRLRAQGAVTGGQAGARNDSGRSSAEKPSARKAGSNMVFVAIAAGVVGSGLAAVGMFIFFKVSRGPSFEDLSAAARGTPPAATAPAASDPPPAATPPPGETVPGSAVATPPGPAPAPPSSGSVAAAPLTPPPPEAITTSRSGWTLPGPAAPSPAASPPGPGPGPATAPPGLPSAPAPPPNITVGDPATAAGTPPATATSPDGTTADGKTEPGIDVSPPGTTPERRPPRRRPDRLVAAPSKGDLDEPPRDNPAAAPPADPAVMARYESGDVAAAIELAKKKGEKELAAKLSRFQTQYEAGQRALAARDEGAALRNLEAALKLDEQVSGGWGKYNAELRRTLSGLHTISGARMSLNGDAPGAYKAFTRALQYDPDNATAKEQLAKLPPGAAPPPATKPPASRRADIDAAFGK